MLVVVDGGARSIHLRVVAYRWLVLTSLLMAVSLTCGCIPWCSALWGLIHAAPVLTGEVSESLYCVALQKVKHEMPVLTGVVVRDPSI